MSTVPILHEAMDRICIGQYISNFSSTRKFRCFQPQVESTYQEYRDDFGPLNMASVARFIQLLDHELGLYPSGRIVYSVEPGRRALTNAVFLVGAYMILKLNMTSHETSARFSWITSSAIELFRDASFAKADFLLTLEDCWRGLEQGKRCGWISSPSPNGQCGQLFIPDYLQLDSPLNADLNAIIPGVLYAFRGPRDLGENASYVDAPTHRDFSPAHFADLFSTLGVTDIVQLNEAPAYDPADFTARGLRHHRLAFAGGALPPPAVAERFLAIAAAAGVGRGAVAVHCASGLGRTGTLIALHLMRARGFAAREAIAWLRIMRPGSVVGVQQHYLEREGDAMRAQGTEAAAAAAAAARVGARRSRCANVRGRIYLCRRADCCREEAGLRLRPEGALTKMCALTEIDGHVC